MSLHFHEPPRVLVVDDTPENIGILFEVLSAAGYDIRVAENGRLAVEQAVKLSPDIILLDVMMPEMDGYEAIQALKNRPDTCEIPVVFMTALAEAAQKVKGFQLGAVDYITKPFEHDEVLARVKTHIRMSRLQHELLDANERLEEANELKDKFFRIARHDLRNPVAVIELTLDFLKNQCDTDRELRDCEHKLDLMKRTSYQMRQIIDNYLDNDEVITLLQGADCKPGDLSDVVHEVVDQCSMHAQSKSIDLRLNIPSGLLCSFFDRSRYHQALTNLVTNAVKFSPMDSQVEVHVIADEGMLRVEVRDDGPGVREEERDKLFQEFANISNKPTGGESSSGLGLWICKRMMEAQGGSCGADFPPYGGSVFWLELPLSKTA